MRANLKKECANRMHFSCNCAAKAGQNVRRRSETKETPDGYGNERAQEKLSPAADPLPPHSDARSGRGRLPPADLAGRAASAVGGGRGQAFPLGPAASSRRGTRRRTIGNAAAARRIPRGAEKARGERAGRGGLRARLGRRARQAIRRRGDRPARRAPSGGPRRVRRSRTATR